MSFSIWHWSFIICHFRKAAPSVTNEKWQMGNEIWKMLWSGKFRLVLDGEFDQGV
jgi:hypothetical protein